MPSAVNVMLNLSIDTFQCRRVQFLELRSLAFLNGIHLSIFRGVGQSYFTLITWITILCFSERNSKAGGNLHNHVVLALSGNIFFSIILLHSTTVYLVWVSVYSCPYFEASLSLVLHWSPESGISTSVKERAMPETISTTTWRWRYLKIYLFSESCYILHQSTGSELKQCFIFVRKNNA